MPQPFCHLRNHSDPPGTIPITSGTIPVTSGTIPVTTGTLSGTSTI